MNTPPNDEAPRTAIPRASNPTITREIGSSIMAQKPDNPKALENLREALAEAKPSQLTGRDVRMLLDLVEAAFEAKARQAESW